MLFYVQSIQIKCLNQTVQTQTKCHIMWHFIWVFAVCQSTHIGVSGLQRVKKYKITFKLRKVINILFTDKKASEYDQEILIKS